MIRKALRSLIDRFPRLSMTARYFRDVGSLSAPATKTPWGFQFAGNADMAEGRFEPEETALVRRLLPSADTFVNIGANIGYYVCHALHAGKRAVAFEPLEENCARLYRNVLVNAWEDRVEVIPVALGSRSGILPIYGGNDGASLLPGWAGTSRKARRYIPLSTLDSLLGSRLDGQSLLILIDVEGAELDVLRGATRFLDMRPRPIWIVEICTTEHQPDGRPVNPHLRETFEIFWSRGYASSTADLLLRPVGPDDMETRVQPPPGGTGTYNYLFVPEERREELLDCLTHP